MTRKSTKEEIAYKLVKLYVGEISRGGEKRQMGLDTIINAYFYTLTRLERKKEELGLFETAVKKEEEAAEELGIPIGDEEMPFERELKKAAEEAKKELEERKKAKEETEEKEEKEEKKQGKKPPISS